MPEHSEKVTALLAGWRAGDQHAAEELAGAVYDEMRRLAARYMRGERPDHTLQATALVHEAYLRLVGDQKFDSRGHFFAAAAEAMRRILVEKARRKKRLRHGGALQKQPLDDADPAIAAPADKFDLLALNDALDRFEVEFPRRAQVVKLRYFAGFTLREVAGMLGIARSTAEADWTYAKAWLRRAMGNH